MAKEPYGYKVVLVDHYIDGRDHMHFHRGDSTIYPLEKAIERVPFLRKETLSPSATICLIPIIPDINEV